MENLNNKSNENTENGLEKSNSPDNLLNKYNFENLHSSIEKSHLKKYVIQIESENTEYFDSFSPEERSVLINKFLLRQQEDLTSRGRNKRLIGYTKHLLIVIFTIIIGLPLTYYLINESVKITAQNYRETQANFEKLYKKRGVTKKDLSKLRRL